jgi:hypothetical protein
MIFPGILYFRCYDLTSRCLGINRNRANCVCLSHGIWLLSLDSDDILMNGLAEVVGEAHSATGAR